MRPSVLTGAIEATRAILEPIAGEQAMGVHADVKARRELIDDVESRDELVRSSEGEPLRPARDLELPGLEVNVPFLRGVHDRTSSYSAGRSAHSTWILEIDVGCRSNRDFGPATRDVEQPLAIVASRRGPRHRNGSGFGRTASPWKRERGLAIIPGVRDDL
jgi:hypothetical protein